MTTWPYRIIRTLSPLTPAIVALYAARNACIYCDCNDWNRSTWEGFIGIVGRWPIDKLKALHKPLMRARA